MTRDDPKRLDLAAARARLAAVRGKQHWRSLDELAGTEEFQEFLHREFPDRADEWLDPLRRRSFLKIMSASLALAGLNACARQPEERIVPYAANPPEELVPGKPLFYATALTRGGYAQGVLVESHMGRPIKIEGNELHPSSLGAADIFAQASILTLYDPDRSQVVTRYGQIDTWETLQSVLSEELEKQTSRGGNGIRILTTNVTSSSLAALIEEIRAKYPGLRWHHYDPVGRDNVLDGARAAFGEAVEPRYDLSKADVIVGIDADFMSWGPASRIYARDFANRRRIEGRHAAMNRLYAVECTPTITGSMADHRERLRPSTLTAFAEALARRLGVAAAPRSHPGLTGMESWLDAVARDLQQHRGSSAVIPGDSAPVHVHALAHLMNHRLGNLGETVTLTSPVSACPGNGLNSLTELARDIDAGKVGVLLVAGGNPVFTAPADLRLGEKIEKVPLSVRLGLYEDETSRACIWHVPQAHELESWGDARAHDGTVSIIQPLIAPLYGGKTPHDLIYALKGEGAKPTHDVVRDYWKVNGLDTAAKWRTALHDGLVRDTAFPAKSLRPAPALDGDQPGLPPRDDEIEIALRPDPTIWDGELSNNGWLQELPKPLTTLTWDNAALMSAATASRLGVANEDVIRLNRGGAGVDAPVWILPGQPDGCVTLHLGYGRTRAGRVGSGAGFNANALRFTDAFWGGGVTAERTGKTHPLSATQLHHNLHGREHLRVGTLEEYEHEPEFARHRVHLPPEASLLPPHPYEGYAWGMSIDLNACIGCNACIIGCQSENNIPIVGKAEVKRGREMHWIRVDRYFAGSLDNPEAYFQPVPCMHCENAPCEVVCPVGATVHGSEGLNEMVYNRCVGTRYCSNNCPYKVRRFNFLQYSDTDTPSLRLLSNPDVTVRMRGVMEKCTYCVQRINAARIEAKKEDRDIRDGEIRTACQASCPTEAITFGNINDAESLVSRRKAGPRSYGLLEELNTHPRTTYLARLRNPNPEIERSEPGAHGHGEGHS